MLNTKRPSKTISEIIWKIAEMQKPKFDQRVMSPYPDLYPNDQPRIKTKQIVATKMKMKGNELIFLFSIISTPLFDIISIYQFYKKSQQITLFFQKYAKIARKNTKNSIFNTKFLQKLMF